MNQPIRTRVTVPLLARVGTNQLESDWIIRGRRQKRFQILTEIIEIENVLLLHCPVGDTVFLCKATLRWVFILCFSFHVKLYIWLSWLSPFPPCKVAQSQFLKNNPGQHSKQTQETQGTMQSCLYFSQVVEPKSIFLQDQRAWKHRRVICIQHSRHQPCGIFLFIS